MSQDLVGGPDKYLDWWGYFWFEDDPIMLRSMAKTHLDYIERWWKMIGSDEKIRMLMKNGERVMWDGMGIEKAHQKQWGCQVELLFFGQ